MFLSQCMEVSIPIVYTYISSNDYDFFQQSRKGLLTHFRKVDNFIVNIVTCQIWKLPNVTNQHGDFNSEVALNKPRYISIHTAYQFNCSLKNIILTKVNLTSQDPYAIIFLAC